MFRTIKIKLDGSNDLAQTARMFNAACQMAVDWGYDNKDYNKTRINRATYNTIRETYPTLPSALVQTARDVASDMLKRSKFKYRPIKKENGSIRYDSRTMKVFLESGYCKLTTAFGRMTYTFQLAKYYNGFKAWKVLNGQLIVAHNCCYLHVQVQCDNPPLRNGDRRLGIDRGITNIAVCSDNTIYNSKKLKNTKGRYQFLKSKLMSVGTQSAKKHLRKLAGRERRFVKDVNHCISKEIAHKDFDVFCIEDLKGIKSRSKGRKFNRLMGNWSFSQLGDFLNYKAAQMGKSVIKVNPQYTSQTCSRCGHREKSNRNGSTFKCKSCGFEINADINAARNIATFSRAVSGRVQSITQTSPVLLDGKPTIEMVGS